MVDLATLAIKIDSSAVEAGVSDLDQLTAAGTKAEGSVDRLSSTMRRAGAAAGVAEAGWVKASSAEGRLRMASDAAAMSASKASAALTSKATGAAAAIMGTGEASKLASHHMMNLGYQLNDVAVGFASGQKPMTIFMQQGSQIAQIMAQAQIGVLGMTAAVGKMVGGFLLAHPLLLASAAAVALVSAGLGLMTDEINKTSKVTVTFGDVMLGTFDVIKEAISTRVTAAFEAMGIDIGNVWEDVKGYTKFAMNFVIGAAVALPKLIAATYQAIPAAFGDAFYSAANLAIAALNKLAQKSAEPLNLIIGGFNAAFGTSIPKIVMGGIDEIANPYKGAMSSLGSAAAKSLVGSFTTDYIGNFANAVSAAAQKRARAAGDEVGKAAGAGAGKAGRAAAKAYVDEFADYLAKVMPELNAMFIKRGGLDEALARNGIGTLDDDLAKIAEAADKAYAATEQGLQDARAAADALNDALRDTIQFLDQLGGVGKSLADALAVVDGLQSGDFRGVRGPVGSLLGLLNQTAGGKDLIGSLTKAMDKVFGGDGSFAKTMTSVLQGAGVGIAAGQAVLGQKSSNVGAAIGGAAGKAIGSILGPIGGAIGSILGGIVGGFIGGLFKKTKTGSASVTGAGITSGGNDAKSKASTSGIGGSVQSSLANIVEALGGTAGDFGFTIGMRKDEYRVSGSAGANVTGKNPSGLIYRGKDAEEAARAALLNAIQDGAIQGIREGAQQLLKAGGSLEAQLAKALKFQNVFDELKGKIDPVGFAVDNIAKEFTKLTAIFKEAGASAAEYADLEKLMGLKREEALQSARQAVIDNLRDPITLQIRALELLGQQQEAVAGARELELLGLKSTLRPLQSMVYQLEDARDIIERFGPLADDLRKFRTELVGNSASGGFAALTAVFRSTAASAALGDADALGKLRGTATSFLDAAKENAGTALDYRRAVGEVLASVDKGIFAADSQVEYAQMQIDAIKNTNNILAQMRAEFAQLQEQVIVNTSTTARIMERFEGDGITILPSSNVDDFIRVRTV